MRHVFLICMTILSQNCLATLTIKDAYARASRGPNSAIFMTIENDGAADTLVGARTSNDVCKHTELHTHIQQGDVFKMRKVADLAIPAKGILALKPGSNHIMLMQLKNPLEEGQTMQITLKFKTHQDQTVTIPVKPLKTCSCSQKNPS